MGQAFRKLFDAFFGNKEMRVRYLLSSPLPLPRGHCNESRFHGEPIRSFTLAVAGRVAVLSPCIVALNSVRTGLAANLNYLFRQQFASTVFETNY
jgi:hypothetical protein